MTIENIKDAVKETVYETKESIKESFEDSKDALKEKISSAEEAIKNKIHNAEQAYEDAKEKVKENIRENYEHVKDILTSFQHEVIGAMLILIGVMGVWLNANLLGKIARQSRRDLLVINLAVANILLCVVAFPFPTISSYLHEWAFDDNMCRYYGFVSLLFGFVIMTTIAMIAIDEYLLFDTGAYINNRDYVNKLMIAYTWVNSLFWSIAPLLGWSRISYEPSGTSCSIMYYPNHGYSSYILSCFIACYILPLFALYYCKTHYGQLGSVKSTQKAMILSKRTMNLLLSFIICWTPYSIVYLWPIITNSISAPFALTVVAPLIAKTSTILTPMIFLYSKDEIVISKHD